MTDTTAPIKVGDEIRLKHSKNSEIVVVEQILARGLATYYLCSWRDVPWTPIMYHKDYVEKVLP